MVQHGMYVIICWNPCWIVLIVFTSRFVWALYLYFVYIQANTTHSTNVGLTLANCRRRWADVKPTLIQCVLFAWILQRLIPAKTHLFVLGFPPLNDPCIIITLSFWNLHEHESDINYNVIDWIINVYIWEYHNKRQKLPQQIELNLILSVHTYIRTMCLKGSFIWFFSTS